MIKINGKRADDCTKLEIIAALASTVKERDDHVRANTLLNGYLGTQQAEIELLRSELNIIKEEIAAIDNFRKFGGAN